MADITAWDRDSTAPKHWPRGPPQKRSAEPFTVQAPHPFYLVPWVQQPQVLGHPSYAALTLLSPQLDCPLPARPACTRPGICFTVKPPQGPVTGACPMCLPPAPTTTPQLPTAKADRYTDPPGEAQRHCPDCAVCEQHGGSVRSPGPGPPCLTPRRPCTPMGLNRAPLQVPVGAHGTLLGNLSCHLTSETL